MLFALSPPECRAVPLLRPPLGCTRRASKAFFAAAAARHAGGSKLPLEQGSEVKVGNCSAEVGPRATRTCSSGRCSCRSAGHQEGPDAHWAHHVVWSVHKHRHNNRQGRALQGPHGPSHAHALWLPATATDSLLTWLPKPLGGPYNVVICVYIPPAMHIPHHRSVVKAWAARRALAHVRARGGAREALWSFGVIGRPGRRCLSLRGAHTIQQRAPIAPGLGVPRPCLFEGGAATECDPAAGERSRAAGAEAGRLGSICHFCRLQGWSRRSCCPPVRLCLSLTLLLCLPLGPCSCRVVHAAPAAG